MRKITALEATFKDKASIENLLIFLADRAGFTKKQRDALVKEWRGYVMESVETANIFRKVCLNQLKED